MEWGDRGTFFDTAAQCRQREYITMTDEGSGQTKKETNS
jgi:hypothetical protein